MNDSCEQELLWEVAESLVEDDAGDLVTVLIDGETWADLQRWLVRKKEDRDRAWEGR